MTAVAAEVGIDVLIYGERLDVSFYAQGELELVWIESRGDVGHGAVLVPMVLFAPRCEIVPFGRLGKLDPQKRLPDEGTSGGIGVDIAVRVVAGVGELNGGATRLAEHVVVNHQVVDIVGVTGNGARPVDAGHRVDADLFAVEEEVVGDDDVVGIADEDRRR